MMKVFIMGLAIVLVVCLCACDKSGQEEMEIIIQAEPQAPTAIPDEDELQSDSEDFEPSISVEIEGFVYSDPDLRMFVYIDNGDWVYYKDRKQEQVYFYNKKYVDNMISMSAYEFTGDVSEQFDKNWEFMKNNLSKLDPVFYDVEEITVGDSYAGYLYRYDIEKKGIAHASSCSCLFWYAGGLMYTCTTSADKNNPDEVQDVLDGILKTFKIF